MVIALLRCLRSLFRAFSWLNFPFFSPFFFVFSFFIRERRRGSECHSKGIFYVLTGPFLWMRWKEKTAASPLEVVASWAARGTGWGVDQSLMKRINKRLPSHFLILFIMKAFTTKFLQKVEIWQKSACHVLCNDILGNAGAFFNPALSVPPQQCVSKYHLKLVKNSDGKEFAQKKTYCFTSKWHAMLPTKLGPFEYPFHVHSKAIWIFVLVFGATI